MVIPAMEPWVSPVMGCPQILLKETPRYLWLPNPSHLSKTYHAFMFELKTFSSFFPYGTDLRRYKCVGLVLEFFMLVKMVAS